MNSLRGTDSRPTTPATEQGSRSQERAAENKADVVAAEGSLSREVQDLQREHAECAQRQADLITVAHLMRDGAQTLLDQYGVDKFFAGAKALGAQRKEGQVLTIYDLIKQLEPDRTKRAELYQKMNTDAVRENEEYVKWEHGEIKDEEVVAPGKDADPKKYHYHGEPNANVVQAIDFQTQIYKAFDGFLGKLLNPAARAALELKVRRLQDLVDLPPEKLTSLKDKLLANYTLSAVVAEMGHALDEQNQHRKEKVVALQSQIEERMDQIKAESDKSLAVYINDRMKDFVSLEGTVVQDVQGSAMQKLREDLNGFIALHQKNLQGNLEPLQASLAKLKSIS